MFVKVCLRCRDGRANGSVKRHRLRSVYWLCGAVCFSRLMLTLLMSARCIGLATCTISPQYVILNYLIGREDVFHVQMSLQMSDAQFPLELCNRLHNTLQRGCIDLIAGEQTIQLTLLGDEQVSKANCLVVHAVVVPLRLSALYFRQAQLRSHVQYVPRPWVMVQFSGFGQSHPLAVEQRLDLVV